MLISVRIAGSTAKAVARGAIALLALLFTGHLYGAQATKAAEEDAVADLSARQGDVSARVVEETACCPRTVTLSVEEGGIRRELRLSGRLEELKRLVLVGRQRLLLAGELPRGGANLLIANLSTLQQEAEIWTYGYGISPSGRWLVYQTHYPRMVPPEARRSIYLLYDLTEPPSANRRGSESEWPEPNLGRPVFPEANVEETWSIFAADHAYHLNSPFLWSEDESRLVFITAAYLDSSDGPTCFVVSIRLSVTGQVKSVHQQELTEENVEMPYLQPSDGLKPEKPLCLIADSLEWVEEGLYDRVVAEPGAASSLGRKVWIEVP